MVELLQRFFEATFMPHGHCFFWKPGLLWLHAGSDAVIALSFFAIPGLLIWFARARKDLAFRWAFVLFGLFTAFCGLTHLMDVWTIWFGTYWVEGAIKAATALLSATGAAFLIPLVPKALELPSPTELRTANEALQQEIDQRKEAEEKLSAQVRETRKKNRLLTLMKEVSGSANEADTFEEALQMSVDTVCERMGWPVGHVFLRKDGEDAARVELRASEIWSQNSTGRFEAFKRETEQLTFARGEGLPGQVLESEETAWVEDVTGARHFPQKEAAERAGLQGAFAVPVLAHGDVVAVLEFYSEEVLPPDAELLEAMGTVGVQIGRVAEREEARQELQELNDALEERARERAQEVYWERERLRSLLDSIPDEVWFCNEEGEISLVNQAVADEFGFESTEMAHRPLADLFLELDLYGSDGTPRSIQEHPLLRSLDGEVIEGEEELLIRPEEGERRHRQINSAPLRSRAGEITGAVAVVRDITELKRTEDELRQRERDFTALANNIPQLAWMADPDGHIFWYNQRWYEYTGTSFEEMEGWGWKKVHHPDHLDRVVETYKKALENVEPFEDTFPLRSQEGEYRWFLTRAMPIRGEDGQVVRWFGTNTDITERLRLEDQLKELNETLEERVQARTRQVQDLASRLTMAEQRERERIARALHEDLQQRLYGNRLQVSSLLAQLRDEGYPEFAGRVEAVEEEIEEVIHEIRRLSVELSPPVLEREGVFAALEWLRSHMQKTRGLEVDLSAEREFRVREEMRVLLFQITRELLSNVSEHAGVGRASVRVREEEGYLKIVVRDQGRGFDPDSLESQDTVGAFGLIAARERLRLFGGALDVHTAPEEGTEVTVRMPMDEGSSVSVPLKNESTYPGNGEDGRGQAPRK